jgi:hypothetical protein
MTTGPTLRPMSPQEIADWARCGFTCARCVDRPTTLEVTLGYRLCDTHAEMTRANWRAYLLSLHPDPGGTRA